MKMGNCGLKPKGSLDLCYVCHGSGNIIEFDGNKLRHAFCVRCCGTGVARCSVLEEIVITVLKNCGDLMWFWNAPKIVKTAPADADMGWLEAAINGCLRHDKPSRN